MKLKYITVVALLGAAIAAPSFAQPGPGMGGMGMGGMGPGPGRYAIDRGNTTGWTLMTDEERTAHQQKMWSFKTYDECKAYQEEHHKAMEARAKEKGNTLSPARHNACDRMKARGVIR